MTRCGGLSAGECGHHGVGEIGVAAPGDTDECAGNRQQRSAADAEANQNEGNRHPDGCHQHGLPAADVGGKIAGDKNRCQIAPAGQAQQQARVGITDVIFFP